MATPPPLSDEQRRAALAKAAAARSARAVIKQRLKSGDLTLRQALASDDEDVTRIKVLSVLESLPGIGKVKARVTMDELGIAHSRRIQGLGPNQQRALLERLDRD